MLIVNVCNKDISGLNVKKLNSSCVSIVRCLIFGKLYPTFFEFLYVATEKLLFIVLHPIFIQKESGITKSKSKNMLQIYIIILI